MTATRRRRGLSRSAPEGLGEGAVIAVVQGRRDVSEWHVRMEQQRARDLEVKLGIASSTGGQSFSCSGVR